MESVEIKYNASLKVKLPLTQPKSKVRVKRRNCFCNYGEPTFTRQIEISQEDYVEWQIGYDFTEGDIDKKSSIKSSFKNSKGEIKIPYELAEILKFSYDLTYLSKDKIINVYDKIKTYEDYFDAQPIKRTNPISINFNGLDFYQMTVEYPMFVNKFGTGGIYTEIINKEQQNAVSVQPMLFLCIPISTLEFDDCPIGRVLKPNECAYWNIGKDEAKLSLLLFQMFGMLSEKHNHDVIKIFKHLFNFI